MRIDKIKEGTKISDKKISEQVKNNKDIYIESNPTRIEKPLSFSQVVNRFLNMNKVLEFRISIGRELNINGPR
jgi:hypothetical protein